MATEPSFGGRVVLSFESRRAKEIETLITTFGGRAVVAPAMREVPLESDAPTLAFASAVTRAEFDVVVFLTGVGARALVDAVTVAGQREAFLEALRRTRVIVRGPKPAAVMRELSVPVWVNAPEPNTWREVVAELDARRAEWDLSGKSVVVQEYGVPNTELLDALRERGARVTAIPTYQWALPEDLAPLADAAARLARGEIDVVLVTTGVQIVHFLRVARDLGLEAEARRGLAAATIASIGPSATAELRRHGFEPAFEPSHPKMGLLVRETAARWTTSA